ncbi:hypothetical protein PR048_008957 [Dryococelus australis]|uniref:Aminopeptidase N n=1 Tax=Dryococelus australis TaxID=614101 RepID=A0ABQ9HYJ7_9NEOP|nr:hypothetical protein PR048_008957 [Dryococelus australis]
MFKLKLDFGKRLQVPAAVCTCVHNKLRDTKANNGGVTCVQCLYIGNHEIHKLTCHCCDACPWDIGNLTVRQAAQCAACSTAVDQFAFVLYMQVHTAVETRRHLLVRRRRLLKFNINLNIVMTDWRLADQFVVQVLHNAFAVDALDSSRPINYEVRTSTEISSVFDTITYDKAGSIIRMMEHVLTNNVFQNGLRRYLKDRAYGVSDPDQLYSSLQEQLNESSELYINVKEVMDTWTNQKGYPVITVTRDYKAGTATVEQDRFLLKRAGETANTQQYKWWVPISLTSSTSADFQTTPPSSWLEPTHDQLHLTGVASSNDWLILNIQQTGYYRVNYDATNWRLLVAQLQSDKYSVVHAVNRAQLLDDSLNLARAGLLDYSTALDITRYLSREHDYVPWYAALSAFRFLDTRLQGAPTTHYQLFKVTSTFLCLPPVGSSLITRCLPCHLHLSILTLYSADSSHRPGTHYPLFSTVSPTYPVLEPLPQKRVSRWGSSETTFLPSRRTGFVTQWSHPDFRIYYHWLVPFLRQLPFPPLFHSDLAPSSSHFNLAGAQELAKGEKYICNIYDIITVMCPVKYEKLSEFTNVQISQKINMLYQFAAVLCTLHYKATNKNFLYYRKYFGIHSNILSVSQYKNFSEKYNSIVYHVNSKIVINNWTNKIHIG